MSQTQIEQINFGRFASWPYSHRSSFLDPNLPFCFIILSHREARKDIIDRPQLVTYKNTAANPRNKTTVDKEAHGGLSFNWYPFTVTACPSRIIATRLGISRCKDEVRQIFRRSSQERSVSRGLENSCYTIQRTKGTIILRQWKQILTLSCRNVLKRFPSFPPHSLTVRLWENWQRLDWILQRCICLWQAPRIRSPHKRTEMAIVICNTGLKVMKWLSRRFKY